MRRRLEGVASISISMSEQTTEVVFARGQAFSPTVFRDAVGESGVKVLSFQIEACGVIEQSEGQRWLAVGEDRFLREERDIAPPGQAVCVSGRLDDRSAPYRLEITDLEVVAD